MRKRLALLLLTVWLIVATLTLGQQPSALLTSPSASPAGNSPTPPERAQIAAGNAFFEDHDFKSAEDAYLRALQSTDPRTREDALRSLQHSLRKRHHPVILFVQALRSVLEGLLRVAPLALGLGGVVVGSVPWIGKRMGRERCILEDLDKANPGFAHTFQLAYHRAW